jgi:hypothetical protein
MLGAEAVDLDEAVGIGCRAGAELFELAPRYEPTG